MRRRKFIHLSASMLASACVIPGKTDLSIQPASAEAATLASGLKRKFTISLNPGSIGVNTKLEELVNYAIDFRFEAVSPPVYSLAKTSDLGMKAIKDKMKENNMQWGSAGLPVEFRKDLDTFKKGLGDLEMMAPALKRAGVTRMNTWIMPWHDSLTYLENFDLHVQRIRQICDVLNPHGIRFGLEYVGPLSFRAQRRHTFVHSLKEVKELLMGIDRPNAGIVLDSFHWYTAHETVEDLLTLKNEDIVAVDLNDARIGRSRDEQLDNERRLPGATGIIDLKAFLNALIKIGYDGPVRAEPFDQALNALPNEAAVTETSLAMHGVIGVLE